MKRILLKPCKAEGTGFSFIYAGGAPVLPIVGTVRCDPHFFSLTTTAQWVAEWFGQQLGIPVHRMHKEGCFRTWRRPTLSPRENMRLKELELELCSPGLRAKLHKLRTETDPKSAETYADLALLETVKAIAAHHPNPVGLARAVLDAMPEHYRR